MLDATEGELVASGTAGNDIISHESGPHSGTALAGGLASGLIRIGGFDSLEFARKSAVTVHGLSGSDVINFNNQALPAEVRVVHLNGGVGDEVITGSAGDDRLDNGDGDDRLLAGDGDDWLSAGHGVETDDGGAGHNRALFMLAEGNDAIALSATSVTINGRLVGLTGIAQIEVDAGSGDDSVAVQATGERFVAQVDIRTGAGDDVVGIDFADRAAATAIRVDGSGSGSDRVTMRGIAGDAGFTAIGPGHTRFGTAEVNLIEIEEPVVLEGVRIDGDRRTAESDRFRFVDGDGDRTTVKLGGRRGSAVIFGSVMAGHGADIDCIELEGTEDRRSTLEVSVQRLPGGDGETSIGSITGSGLKALRASRSNILSHIDMASVGAQMEIDDVADGVTIHAGGSFRPKPRLAADAVGDVTLTTSKSLRAVRVARWVRGLVQAPGIGSVVARSGFAADLISTRAYSRDLGIGHLDVQGDLTSSILADRVGRVTVRHGDARLDIRTSADAVTLDGQPAILSLAVHSGDLLAPRIVMQQGTMLASLSVGGTLVGSGTIVGRLGSASVGKQEGTVTIDGIAANVAG